MASEKSMSTITNPLICHKSQFLVLEKSVMYKIKQSKGKQRKLLHITIMKNKIKCVYIDSEMSGNF